MFNRKKFNSFQFNPEMTVNGIALSEGAVSIVTANAFLKLISNSSVEISLTQEANSSLLMVASGNVSVEAKADATPILYIDGFGSEANVTCSVQTTSSVIRMIGKMKSEVRAISVAEPFLFSWKEKNEPQDIWNEAAEENENIWLLVPGTKKDWRVKNA